ncbi:MAG: hypothetical protein QG552_2173, partial [Thermodesulfobacteriota bacterium]|nr:hypothetical protein [Thermodesulfobacteriota bacterium]
MRVNRKWVALETVFLCILISVRAGFALDVPLTVKNPEPVWKSSEPVTFGVPFAEGVLADSSKVTILDSQHTELPAQFLITARWPDNSVRWLLCDFQTDLGASGSAPFTLRAGADARPVNGIMVDDQTDTLTVRTGSADFLFAKSELRIQGNAFTATYTGTDYTAAPTSASSWFIEENGPMKVGIRIEGHFR